MHRPVCAHPFLHLLQARLCVTVNDPLGTVKTSGKEAHLRLLFLIFPISVWLFGNRSVCQHPTVLSHLGSCSVALEQAWVTSSCALAIVICVWKYRGALSAASGSRVQADIQCILLSRKASWHLGTMFHLLTRLRVRKIMPINFIIELLDCSDQSQWFVGLDEEHCLLPVI